ncbi:uncharacterized protein MICPUCDRAFT_65518 [Micromonas pusilla CCMP1545]|uniref:Predicted protein n=1 Tax=Micromonas pusilla (strain CCMP1545) TaxID=564608 RepID=C1MW03_MICPC|nr:uncharacterized protein MICPUCDRAFT_65518 [Micromonas pusilla CCMP1545]EEH56080.1 predicted protein [Micromonas pusilla CCMP1545]|eukprot:XP_003060128.1 predicted protein [Micromonas pusilla CCMP1545]
MCASGTRPTMRCRIDAVARALAARRRAAYRGRGGRSRGRARGEGSARRDDGSRERARAARERRFRAVPSRRAPRCDLRGPPRIGRGRTRRIAFVGRCVFLVIKYGVLSRFAKIQKTLPPPLVLSRERAASFPRRARDRSIDRSITRRPSLRTALESRPPPRS